MVGLNNNNESFKLLGGSAESDVLSEVPELVLPRKKKRLRKRLRSSVFNGRQDYTSSCYCTARTISLTLVCVVLVCWLVALTWLAVVLHREITQLQLDVRIAVAGNQGVTDALQNCHSQSRDLQKNQSQIIERLASFEQLLGNFSLEASEVKAGLHTVQDQLKSSPDLISNPRMIKDLSASVASFGSQIKDLNTTVLKMKDQNSQMDESLRGLAVNVTDSAAKLAELSNQGIAKSTFTAKEFLAEKEAIMTVIGQIAANLTTVNETLTSKLQWNVDDLSKDHKLVESLQEMNQNVTARIKTLEALLVLNKPSGRVSTAPSPEPKQHPPTAWTIPFAASATSAQDTPTTVNTTNLEAEGSRAKTIP